MQAGMIAMKIFGKPWVKGMICGFVFGVLLAIVSAWEVFNGTALESVPQFLGALPAFIILDLLPDVPELFAPLVYFTYWIAVGGLIGWGMSKGKFGKAGVIILIIVLLLSHFKAYLILQKEFSDASGAWL